MDLDAGILSFAVGTVKDPKWGKSEQPARGGRGPRLSRYTVPRTVLEDKSHSRLPRLPHDPRQYGLSDSDGEEPVGVSYCAL